MNSVLVYVVVEQRTTYQLIVLYGPLAPELGKPPPLTLKRPALHLFIRHKLQRAVAHAHQRERRATVEPAPTLVAVYHAEPAWSIRINGRRNSAKSGHALQRSRCAAGEF